MNRRRTFLKMLAAAPVVACGGGSGAPASFGTVTAGNVSATSVGSLTVVANAPAILGRDQDGLYAMTSTCTHQGCEVEPSASDTLFCPCHSSRFDRNGKVLGGPAPSPLVHFAVSIDGDGNITVDGAKQVGASVRTQVTPAV